MTSLETKRIRFHNPTAEFEVTFQCAILTPKGNVLDMDVEAMLQRSWSKLAETPVSAAFMVRRVMNQVGGILKDQEETKDRFVECTEVVFYAMAGTVHRCRR